MIPLELIGLLLIASGVVLLAVVLLSRRRAARAVDPRPRTVADLVRLRTEAGGADEAQPAPAPVAAVPVAAPPASAAPAASPVMPPAAAAPAAAAPAAAAPAAAAPASAVPASAMPSASPVAGMSSGWPSPAPRAPEPEPEPAPTAPAPEAPAAPVADTPRMEPEPPAALPLDVDSEDTPWQRAALMAAGFAGGQAWQEQEQEPEPEPEPVQATPLRLVRNADPAGPTEVAVPSATITPETAIPPLVVAPEPAAPAEPAPAEAAQAEADVPVERAVPVVAAAPEDDAPAEPVLPAPALLQPVPDALPDGGLDAAGSHDGDPEEPELPAQQLAGPVALAAVDRATEPVEPVAVDGWDEEAPESVPAGAVPERFADERPAEPGSVSSSLEPSAEPGQSPSRRGRRTPDERAAEQAAADLALLRTFGFADPGMRPDSAPVVAMERANGQAPPAEAGDAQPVRYRAARRDGTAVAGAAVTLLDDRGGDVADGTADDDGRGEVLAPTPGSYVLVSTAAGHLPGAVAVTVGGSAAEVDVLLARSASVSGAVSGEDGPIVGARVTLVQDGEVIDAVDTDGDGGYRIGDIGAGEYGLSVAAAGCEPVATLIDVTEESDVHHDVDLVPASPVAESADGLSTDDLSIDDVMSGQR